MGRKENTKKGGKLRKKEHKLHKKTTKLIKKKTYLEKVDEWDKEQIKNKLTISQSKKFH